MDTINSTIKESFNTETKITKYTWSIYKKDLRKFKDLPCASHAQSNLFTTNDFTNIKWHLRCYPHGTNEKSSESCKMFLRLKSMPKEYKIVKAYYYIRCLETKSCIENVNKFTKNADFSGWNARTQLTSDLNNCTSITFEAGIRILKITDTNTFPIYKYLLPATSIKNQYTIEWNINNNLFATLSQSHNGRWVCGTLLSSTNHMFSIACCPNGEKEKDKGYLSLFFIIVSFPNDIESIKINFSLKCAQLNKTKNEIYKFSEQKYSRGWPRFCAVNQLANIKSMNIICNANIMEMYDKNGNVISDEIKEETKEKETEKFKPKEIKIENYNSEIVNELINLGVGAREECIAASLLVVNSNDINEVKDKIYELQNTTMKSPTTVIESVSSISNQFTYINSKKRKYISRQSAAEPFSPIPLSPISNGINGTNNLKNKIGSNLNSSFDMNTKIFKFTWKINEFDVSKFKDLPTGQYVLSNQFSTDIKDCPPIKWTIRCYPAGMNSSSSGSCKMYLCLNTFTNINAIVIYYYIRCIETHTCTEFIREFTKYQNNSGWKTRRQLSSELNNKNIANITFEIGIRILKIFDINKNIIYRYPLQLLSIKKQYQLIWHINNNLLNIFRSAHYAKSCDAMLITSKNSMFSIQCYPNGYDETHKGFLSLYFIVVAFPIGVHAMKVKFKLKCSKLKYIKEYVFSQEKYGRGWDKFCVAKSCYMNVKSMDITCDIDIIELYDKNNNVINAKLKQEQKEQNNYEKKIANLQQEIYKYKKLLQNKTNTIRSLQDTVNKNISDQKTLQKRFDDIAQASVRQRNTIQRRKTLTDSHQQMNSELRAQLLAKDEEIKQLKSKNEYLNKRVNYKLISERKEKDNSDNNLFKLLTDLNNNIEIFKENYNENILKESFEKSLENIIKNVNNNIENILLAFEIVEKYTDNMKIFITHNLLNENINEYKKWDLKQIITWIMGLDNGKYIKYISKLCKGFKYSDITTGDVLPELTRTDLSNPPFSINEFAVKRDLEKHFQSLAQNK